jgi:hypothetical protein
MANKDSWSYSLSERSGLMVSAISVTKLPANVAKLSEHQIIIGMTFLILFDINNFTVSATLVLKSFSIIVFALVFISVSVF